MSSNSYLQFLEDLLGFWLEESDQVLENYLEELSVAFDKATEFSFWLILPTQTAARIIGLFIDILDSTQELMQDMGLVGLRVIERLIEEYMPLPRKMGQKVIKLDDAVRLVLKQIYGAAINVMDGDLPAEVDVALTSKKIVAGLELKRQWDLSKALQALKGSVLAWAVIGFGNLIKMTIAWTLIVLTGAIYVWAWRDGQKILSKQALPQDSQRVYEHGHRHRRNLKKGPDK